MLFLSGQEAHVCALDKVVVAGAGGEGEGCEEGEGG